MARQHDGNVTPFAGVWGSLASSQPRVVRCVFMRGRCRQMLAADSVCPGCAVLRVHAPHDWRPTSTLAECASAAWEYLKPIDCK